MLPIPAVQCRSLLFASGFDFFSNRCSHLLSSGLLPVQTNCVLFLQDIQAHVGPGRFLFEDDVPTDGSDAEPVNTKRATESSINGLKEFLRMPPSQLAAMGITHTDLDWYIEQPLELDRLVSSYLRCVRRKGAIEERLSCRTLVSYAAGIMRWFNAKRVQLTLQDRSNPRAQFRMLDNSDTLFLESRRALDAAMKL